MYINEMGTQYKTILMLSTYKTVQKFNSTDYYNVGI